MLNPFDDYPIHQTSVPITETASGDRNHYDRYFFNGYDPDGEVFFAAAMGLYPNRSVIDASFSVLTEGRQRSVFASGRAPLDRRDTSVGPVRVEVVEPLRELRLVVDEKAHGVGCDLRWRARTVAIQEPRFIRHTGTRVVMDYTRLTQFGSWEGTVVTGDRQVEVRPDRFVGCRDRSWGVRMVGEPEGGAPRYELPQFFWLWAPLNFGDVALHFDVCETETGERWHQGGFVAPVLGADDPVLDPGGLPVSAEPLRAVDWHIEWEPGTRRAQVASLQVQRWGGEPEPVALEPLATFQMRGIGYMNPDWSHGTWRGELETGSQELVVAEIDRTHPANVHIQELVRARWGDRTGTGVLEQLALGPHAPTGLTGLFDGAEADAPGVRGAVDDATAPEGLPLPR